MASDTIPEILTDLYAVKSALFALSTRLAVARSLHNSTRLSTALQYVHQSIAEVQIAITGEKKELAAIRTDAERQGTLERFLP